MGQNIYNSRNSKDLIVLRRGWGKKAAIYNSRNSKDLIVIKGKDRRKLIYNSRNSKDLIVFSYIYKEIKLSTTVEIQKT